MARRLELIQGNNCKGSVVLVDLNGKPLYRLNPGKTIDGLYALEDELIHSVVLDDFYLKTAKDKKELSNSFRRRGRSIEVVVPVAYVVKEFDGINFYVASFKGAGAIPENKVTTFAGNYVIDPITWRSNGFGGVIQSGRIWGGLDIDFAKAEAENDVLSTKGIFYTPYVAQNQIPINVQEEIYRKSDKRRQHSDPDLYQIVRLSITNIRYDTFMGFKDKELKLFAELTLQAGWTLEEWAKHLGSVDGKLVSESLKLARKGKFFNFAPKGLMDDNRFISGEITDLEQVVISSYSKENDYWPWPMAIMCQTKDFLRKVAKASGKNPQEVIDYYFDVISNATGLKFSGGHQEQETEPMHQNHVSEYHNYLCKLRK